MKTKEQLRLFLDTQQIKPEKYLIYLNFQISAARAGITLKARPDGYKSPQEKKEEEIDPSKYENVVILTKENFT